MQRFSAFLVSLVCLAVTASASSPRLADYLPAGVTYDPAVPVPSSVLGWEVGEWHVRHDPLVAYMEAVAASSDRVTIEETGRTHEDRRLVLLTITAPENQARIDEIRREHLVLADPEAEMPDVSEMPVVTWMGYSIHGNEPSGSNAALLVAYHLAAAQGPEIEEQLRNAVILLDPSFNPDGLSRFAQWANMHRGHVLVEDPTHREHREQFPSGRTNHYWFDLNRDWLPAVHPESRARLRQFHAWKPNVLTDHHEMGTNSTYFFQPGIPIRKNPLTPDRNVELTGKLAEFHGARLDEAGSLYYTEETFDDFYYGKGSTYPDANGAVGVLFEQASSRGHLQESVNGPLSFPFTIKNQFITSLSTLEGSLALREDFLRYQGEFYRGSVPEAAQHPVKAYVFGDSRDRMRNRLLVELLRLHEIQVHALAETVTAGGETFEPGNAWVVPSAQAQHRLIRTIFEQPTEFADSSFYDVSAWTLPLSHGLPFAGLGAVSSGLLGDPVDTVETAGRVIPAKSNVAWVFDWDEYYAPRALYRLLEGELRVRVATQPLHVETADGPRKFEVGAIVVPLGIQEVDAEGVAALMSEVATDDGVDIWAVQKGLTAEGVDLGSPSLRPLELPKLALVVGSGVNTYDAGHLWHLLDRRYELPVSLVDKRQINGLDLNRYTHLLLVSGRYDDFSEAFTDRLQNWVQQGGVVIAQVGAAAWADRILAGDSEEESARPSSEPSSEAEKKERVRYADNRHDRAKSLISGAIFQVELDTSHPIAYGYRRDMLPVFRSSRQLMPAPADPYTLVAAYTEEPRLAGYVSDDNLAKLAGTSAVVAQRVGGGALVKMIDTQSFRGFWYGTDRLMLNSIFFAPILNNTRGGFRQ